MIEFSIHEPITLATLPETTHPPVASDERDVLSIYHRGKDSSEDYRSRLCADLCGTARPETHKNIIGDLYHEASDVGTKPPECAPVLVLLFSICRPYR